MKRLSSIALLVSCRLVGSTAADSISSAISTTSRTGRHIIRPPRSNTTCNRRLLPAKTRRQLHYCCHRPAFIPSQSPRTTPIMPTITSTAQVIAPKIRIRHHDLPATRVRTLIAAKPKRGSVVDSYQTVSVNCSKCRTRLFRYKKKNGTKSNLVKCYIERISEDSAGVLERMEAAAAAEGEEEVWCCPECNQRFARRTLIHGRPALKLVGGKVRMTKK